MSAALIGACALLGVVVGSFLNVVIWRLPRGESVIAPRSRCPSCGALIGARDNVPVLSWLLLRGRCRSCRAPISPRYPLVELASMAAFGIAAWAVGAVWTLPAFLYLAAVSVALAMIDIDVHRLPNAIVLPSYPIGAVLLAAPAVAHGEWAPVGRMLVGAAALFTLYFLLALIYPAGMGFGDVKLAGVLGGYLAFLGWGEFVVGSFMAFLLGGVVGVLLMLLGKAGRRTAIPFGPFMVAGAWVAIVAGSGLWEAYRGLSSLS